MRGARVLASEPRPDAALGTAIVATDPGQLDELRQAFALAAEPPALDLARFVVIGTYLDAAVCSNRVDLRPIGQGYTQSRDSEGPLERVVLGVGRDIDCQGDTTRRAVIYASPDAAPSELSITAPRPNWTSRVRRPMYNAAYAALRGGRWCA